MINISKEKSEYIFTVLLGLAFAALFFRQALIHLVAVSFVITLILARPRLPWIAPFWWMALFIVWEWLSNYLGPYHGQGMEGGGIGYHFLFIFLPLSLQAISKIALISGVSVGALASASLIWAQGVIGVDLNASPLRINWDGGRLFARPLGFNGRPWETQFIHSLVSLAVFPYLVWRKFYSWLLILPLLTGVVLPQIRGVIAAFLGAFGIQLLFLKEVNSLKQLLRNIIFIAVVGVACLSIIAFLHPGFTKNLSTGNGRDKIFTASFEVFKQYPHTGLGGGRYFKEHYQQAWVDLGWHKDRPSSLEMNIGHTHNDALMLLAHHGWPALLLWLAFVLHCIRFVWQYGTKRERTVFISLVAMHHIAGLAETYLDYSNTAYAIFLCYGLALHGPIKRWDQGKVKAIQ